jgi:hypothetical protein
LVYFYLPIKFSYFSAEFVVERFHPVLSTMSRRFGGSSGPSSLSSSSSEPSGKWDKQTELKVKQLFERHTIEEIKVIEKQTKDEIEDKKRELRSLVG